MTAAAPRAGSANGGDLARRDRSVPATGSPGGPVGRAPVIVLATEYSGTERLRRLLDGLPDLACTSGTGVLPLCDQAAAVWRIADGRPSGQPSRLAAVTTRALAESIIISVLAREGKRRWCEFSYALPEVAETFALLYPGTRFVCLYRSCGDVIRAVLDASPWGIADPVFAPFTRAYPASTAAALAAYWIAHTSSLLAFEEARPQAVLRIRYEDLAEAEEQTASAVMSFLGIASRGGDTALALEGQDRPGTVLSPAKADLPAGLIPPSLLAQANNLLKQLDYPVLPDSSRWRRL
jgi:hypothetical protein